MLQYNKTIKVYTWNLPAGKTCPGTTEYCARYCYARKRHFSCENVQRAHEANLTASRRADFVTRMTGECTDKYIIRVHSSGDFYSPEYIDKWIEIARQCPGPIFFAYTRTWRIPRFLPTLEELSSIPNFSLIASTDPSCLGEEIPTLFKKTSYFGPAGSNPGLENCLKQLEHGRGCPECGRCFDRTTRQIVFKRH